LHYAVLPVKTLSNIVYQTTTCSVLNHDKSVSYVLFDDQAGDNEKVDSYVNPVRFRPYFFDELDSETCAVDDKDKFSYTVFEFMDVNAGNAAGDGQDQHISLWLEMKFKNYYFEHTLRTIVYLLFICKNILIL
jgi:hypothetical protein